MITCRYCQVSWSRDNIVRWVCGSCGAPLPVFREDFREFYSREWEGIFFYPTGSSGISKIHEYSFNIPSWVGYPVPGVIWK